MDHLQDLLSKPVDDAVRPEPMPAGSYIFAISAPKFDKSKEKKTDFVKFTFKPIQPMADVDQTELARVVATWNGRTLSDKEMEQDFYLTPDSVWRLKEFLIDAVGVPSGIPLGEQIQAAAGMQVVGMVTHAMSRNGQATYANITQFAKVPNS